jgi:cobalt/nickel transport protein
MSRQNIILLAAAALIAAVPLFMTVDSKDAFSGADAKAGALVQELRPDYTPWAEALWTPPSREIESLLFMLQAALGAGCLGYYLGLRRGESRARGEAKRQSGGARSSGPRINDDGC